MDVRTDTAGALVKRLAAGGSSGIYLDGLLQRLGIADVVRGKAVLVPGGLVAERLVTGEADMAIHQISEIMPRWASPWSGRCDSTRFYEGSSQSLILKRSSLS